MRERGERKGGRDREEGREEERGRSVLKKGAV